jgi:NTE family protein
MQVLMPPPAEPTPLQQRGQLYIDRMRDPTARHAQKPGPEPRIGIALGGGAARGLTHIPYIEAMDELGLRPAVISGTSIGALIGSGWAWGMTGKDLREHAYDVLGTLRIIAGKLWGAQIRLGSIFQNGLSVQLDASSVVDAFLPPGFPDTFEQLKTPLYVVATDFHNWHQAVFNSGLIRPAIGGSIAMPNVFKPVTFMDRTLVDGGVVNPLPLDQAAFDTDILVGIDVNGDPSDKPQKANMTVLDIWFGSAQIMMHALSAHMMAAYPPHIYMRPHVHSFGALEFWRVREIVESVDEQKDQFKRQLSARIEDFIANGQRTAEADQPNVAPPGRR